MKKTLLFAFLLALPFSAVQADELGPNQRWIERIDGLLSVPSSSDVSSNVNLGFGGGLSFGYRVDEHFNVSIASGYYQYDFKNLPAGDSGNFSYVPLMLVFNYSFGEGPFRPYLSYGVGAAFNTYVRSFLSDGVSVENKGYETSFFMSPAIGGLVILSPGSALFLEARMDMNYRSFDGGTGLPVSTPTVFIPIQAGLVFFVI